jgi:hypothetical protein
MRGGTAQQGAPEEDLLQQGGVDPQAQPVADPAPDVDPTAEPQADQPQRRVAPRQALDQERARARRLKEERDQLRAERDTMRQQQDALRQRIEQWQLQQQYEAQRQQQEAQKQKEEAAKPKLAPPDQSLMARNPVSYFKQLTEYQQHLIEEQRKESQTALQRVEEQTRQFSDFQNVVAQTNALRQEVEVDEAMFMQQRPDYAEAVDYLQGMWARMLAPSLGNDPGRIQQAVQNWTHQLIAAAKMNSLSPAQAAYQTALNIGYRARNPDDGRFDRRPPAPQPQANPGRLQAIQRGQEMSRGVAAPGAAPRAMSLEQLANLPQEEFNKMAGAIDWDRLWK